ncbi:4-(cytidine 5'-diphospho)-2-C-methyl-D-erythritol kinase [Streptomyces sp. NBC_01276]|uniref:4-(cytidine 5'-diphospho)-2-C-methyl-D-erythritol kinase n=1 Tax=Streptomyces sp. NBC_01276 TaxID=2903808 RepID=UPI00352E16A5
MSYVKSIAVRAPAKVNLQLGVGGRRDDGYHELASIFLTVSLFDRITLTPAEELRVTVAGAGAGDVPADGSNIAARAVGLLAERNGLHPGVHVHIDKRIPVQGGMAGGSADAAGALVGCNALWNLGVSRTELVSLAAELGSDVPFSVLGGAAFGSGRGERLTVLPVGATTHWVFATAGFGLSTPAVFAEQERRRRDAGMPWTADGIPSPRVSQRLVDALARGDTAMLADALSNDLQPVATSMRPELAATLRTGTDAGALAGVLCGSGATIGFLVADRDAARTVAEKLMASGTCAAAHVADGPVPGPEPEPEPEETITTGENA